MMNRYEEFRIRILERAATATQSKPYVSVAAQALANHGIPPSHVREELLQLAQTECIALSAPGAASANGPQEAWVDADSLFSNTTDKGYVRIRLLAAGAELLSKAVNFAGGRRVFGGSRTSN